MARRTGTPTLLALVLAITSVGTPDTFAQNVSVMPAGATPGGSRLVVDRRSTDQLMAQLYDLEIPPLVERPLGAEEGPRIRVIEFQVDGVVDRPENNVATSDIGLILLEALAIQPFEGFTMGELQGIADNITNYYRGKDMILAQAVVPAQDVVEGTLRLQVFEGVLNSVAVEGNDIYSTQRITGPFNDLIQQAVDRSNVEEAILNLQDMPGLTVFGTFRQGQALGQTELLVSVRDEDRFYIRPSVDNYGSELTGDVRTTLEWGVNNMVGASDRLSGYLVQTASPDDGRYYGFDYRLATPSARNRFGFGALKNRFDATPASTSLAFLIQGEVKQSNMFYQRAFANRREFRADGVLDFAQRDAVTRLDAGPLGQVFRDDLKVLSYTFNYYAAGRGQRAINVGYFRVSGGDNDSAAPSRQGGSGAFAVGNYSSLGFNYQRLQRFADHHALLLRLEGQKTDDMLVSLEQYSIGGPANVRAYPVAEALVDTGYAGTLEWIIDAPGFADRAIGDRTWGDIFQLSFFRDYAGGEINDPRLSEVGRYNLRGYGIGLLFTVTNKLYLRIDGARPASNPAPSSGEVPQYYMSFSYTF